jgi:hypothetical protein
MLSKIHIRVGKIPLKDGLQSNGGSLGNTGLALPKTILENYKKENQFISPTVETVNLRLQNLA